MPLRAGKSKKVVAENVREEIKSGRPVDQAVAIAYEKAGHGNSKKKRGKK